MPQVSERRKTQRRGTLREVKGIWVRLENAPGVSFDKPVRVLDASKDGLGVELLAEIPKNSVVIVHGEAGNSFNLGKARARVLRCVSLPGGRFKAGLAYEKSGASEVNSASAAPLADYYEVMQVSPKADPETIHRVYRILAHRFHPDNADTGNSDIFRRILEAYEVLSEPQRRAAYDVNYHVVRQLRFRVFEQGESTLGKAAEKATRRGILDLLYTARINQPAQPAVSLQELEELLGCPREHLEFSLWYLKENGLVTRSDAGRFAITVKGVDQAEMDEQPPKNQPRLMAAK
jgi:DnaJ domain